jgi:hypothetical protein
VTSKLVKQAFNEVAKLPENKQEAVAAWLLEELASERRWQQTFSESQDVLAPMADEAVREHKRGQTAALGGHKRTTARWP